MVSDPADAARRRVKQAKSKPRPAIVTAGPPSAAIVVDAKTGRVLYERDADELRHPASITKVMTLYLLFEELEAGRMTLDTRLQVSAHAARQPPTKLGLPAGSTIRVEDAIKAMVTKSANDMAVTVAENIAGSEDEFAERMTRKARALGMTRTVYRNASGLPNREQITTARDLSILGRAVQERFPRYYAYFSTRVFTFAGRSMPNHNRLLGNVEGVDGIKTGYTNASGFNLLTSVKTGGRHVVGVVLGGRTGASRDAKMRELIALNLPKASNGGRTAPLIAEAAPVAPSRVKPAVVAEAVPPIPLAPPAAPVRAVEVQRPVAATMTAASTRPLPPVALSAPQPGSVVVAPLPAPVAPIAAVPLPAPAPALPARAETVATLEERAQAPSVDRGPNPVTAPSLRWVVGAQPTVTGSVARYGAAVPAQPVRTASLDPVGALAASGSAVAQIQPTRSLSRAAVTEPTPAPAAEIRMPPRSGWYIQIGATPDEETAKELLSKAQKAARVLAGAEPFTEPVVKDNTTLYRARFAGLDQRSAKQACDALKRADIGCFAIKN